jgi:aryl-alcohol dehydrogenase-like predicted oxidoreductase
MFDFRAERVISSVDESLRRMGVEYIDSIQACHEQR